MDSLSACDTSPMVTFQNVSKSYVKGKKAVDGLTLDVPDGAIYGFLGPNGAGKSTTIKMMASLLLPDAGKLTIGGHAPRRPIRCLPQTKRHGRRGSPFAVF